MYTKDIDSMLEQLAQFARFPSVGVARSPSPWSVEEFTDFMKRLVVMDTAHKAVIGESVPGLVDVDRFVQLLNGLRSMTSEAFEGYARQHWWLLQSCLYEGELLRFQDLKEMAIRTAVCHPSLVRELLRFAEWPAVGKGRRQQAWTFDEFAQWLHEFIHTPRTDEQTRLASAR